MAENQAERTRISGREIKRYQLQWQPSFPATVNGAVRMYVVGEKKKYTGDSQDEANLRAERDSQDPDEFSKEEIVRVAYNSTIIIPFNTSVALAQEYTPDVSNKIVEYHSLGGNSVTTFGEAIRKIGLSIKIIKAGRMWETYVSGLEAVTYLSANQGRYFGSLYLLGFDAFHNGTQNFRGRYKVTVNKLTMQQASQSNTTVSADMQLTVLQDYSHLSTHKKRVWGSL